MPKDRPAPKSPMLDNLSRKRRPQRKFVTFIDDPEPLQQALTEAQQADRLAILRHGRDSEEVNAAREALKMAKAALADATQTIVVYSIAPSRLTTLMHEHPPTAEGKASGDEWNPETFQPALIAACAVDSGMTEEQWAEELNSDRWPMGERNALFAEALAVNVGNLRFAMGR